MDYERITYRNELNRNKDGHLTQITRGQIDMLRHLVSYPKILALGIKVVEIAHTDENHHQVYISVERELVAIVLFNFRETEGNVVWQQSSKGSAYETGDHYSYVKERILKTARDAYQQDKTLYGPKKERPEFLAYGGRINKILQYEVTVAKDKKVIAVVQFSEGSLDGTIFWQKTFVDKNNNNTADRFAAREKDIVKVAQQYYVEKQPWPILNFRTTPYPDVPVVTKSLS